jgi:hypothetical protein
LQGLKTYEFAANEAMFARLAEACAELQWLYGKLTEGSEPCG